MEPDAGREGPVLGERGTPPQWGRGEPCLWSRAHGVFVRCVLGKKGRAVSRFESIYTGYGYRGWGR